MNLEALTPHPAAAWFPILAAHELQQLAADIKANGQREPIRVWGDRIIDGRNRLEACKIAGVAPVISPMDFADDDAAVSFILSTNLHRRHLNDSQRAMIAARSRDFWRERAKDRQKQHGATVGQNSTSAQLSLSESGKWTEDAGRALNVGAESVRRAAKVVDHGSPTLKAMVECGDVAVSAAALVAQSKSPDEQERIATAGPKAVTTAARDVRNKETADDPSVEMRDDAGTVLPVRLVPIFRNGRELASRSRRELARLAAELEESRDLDGRIAAAKLRELVAQIKLGVPALVCEKCSGRGEIPDGALATRGCTWCTGRGWLPAHQHRAEKRAAATA